MRKPFVGQEGYTRALQQLRLDRNQVRTDVFGCVEYTQTKPYSKVYKAHRGKIYLVSYNYKDLPLMGFYCEDGKLTMEDVVAFQNFITMLKQNKVNFS
jgi:hypothetical protein